ncbi:MAG TPA: class E sortase [Microthrixaceae bacterium]|nr:class E sortase [Microthrixaceae bacterium]
MLGKFLGGLGRVLIISGLVVLGFVGYQLWGTGLETARAQGDLTEGLAAGLADEPAEDRSDGEEVDAATLDLAEIAERLAEVDPATAPPMPPPPAGEPLGVIEIPKIGLEWAIVEGVSKEDLKKGPGHYPGTALPGQAGNAGIAGHRTTYGAPFNRIDELVPGDEIRVTTPQGRFVYEVIPAPGQDGQAWYAVPPTRVEVLEDVGDNRLTLTACHPKYSARERIIVHARLAAQPAATPEAVSVQRPEVREEVALDFDDGLEGDPDALPRALAFGGGAAALMVLAWVLARHVRRWVVYALATPGVLVLIWFGYVHMDRYLPAL